MYDTDTDTERASTDAAIHGKLWTRLGAWDVYFLDAMRVGNEWIVECVAVGPRVRTVTVFCDAGGGPGHVAGRVTESLRNWLANDDHDDEAYLQVPPVRKTA